MLHTQISAFLSSPPEAVWQAVTDNTDYAWRSGIDELRVLSDTTFVEKSGRMETYFTITHFEPCRLYAFDMQNSRFSGRWTGTFSAYGTGTQVVFTETLQFKNPVVRAVAFCFMPLHKMQRTYLQDLRKKLGEAGGQRRG